MENLNLLGIQVNSMNEAIELLGCTKETLTYNESQVSLNGITFNLSTYSFEGSKDFYFAVNAYNLSSNQYDNE